MTNKHVMSVASGICSATLLFAFGGAAYGHDDDWSRTDKPLVWVDSKGKTIGRAVDGDSGGHGAVQLRVQGFSLIVPVGNEQSNCSTTLGFPFPLGCDASLRVNWAVGGIVFERSDCTGTAYVVSLFSGSDRAVGIYGKTLYIGDDSPTSKLIVPAPKAVLTNGVCDPNVPPDPFNTFHGWKVDKTVGLWTLGFKPPFSLR